MGGAGGFPERLTRAESKPINSDYADGKMESVLKRKSNKVIDSTHHSQVPLPPLTDAPQHCLQALQFPIKHEHAKAAVLFIVGLQIGTRAHHSFQNLSMDHLKQGSQTCGPRANRGPQDDILWPPP